MWSGGTVIAGGKGPVCQIAMVDRARPYVERSKSSATGAPSGVQSVIHSHVFCVVVSNDQPPSSQSATPE